MGQEVQQLSVLGLQFMKAFVFGVSHSDRVR